MRIVLGALLGLALSLLPASAQNYPTFNVKEYGVAGNGTRFDEGEINRVTSLIKQLGGGTLYFPCGTYLIARSIHVHSNTKVEGAGPCTIIKARDSGWSMATTDTFGILNVKNAANVEITSLTLQGTKSAPGFNLSPKLIYYETVSNLNIHHNTLLDAANEGIWGGGLQKDNVNGIIAHNYIANVGHPNSYTGLPAIQINGFGWIVDGNVLINTGTAIGASGQNTVVSNNYIQGVTVTGIGTGDGARPSMINIIGNVIIIDPTAFSVSGILLADGNDDPGAAPRSYVTVTGNSIRTVAGYGPGHYSVCIYGTDAPSAKIDGNYCEITSKGAGFQLYGTPAGSTYTVTNNTVRYMDQAKNTYMAAFVGIPNGPGNRLAITSANNSVVGLSDDGDSYAYRYHEPNGGTLTTAVMSGDWTAGGSVGIGNANFPARSIANRAIFLDALHAVGIEREWKPTLMFGTAASGQTGTFAGRYTRSTTNQVSISVNIALSAKGGSGGNAVIANLPVAATETGGQFLCAGNANMANIGGPIFAQVSGRTLSLFTQGPTGSAPLTDANFTATSTLTCAGTYQAVPL